MENIEKTEKTEKTYQPKWKYFAQRLKDVKIMKDGCKIFLMNDPNYIYRNYITVEKSSR